GDVGAGPRLAPRWSLAQARRLLAEVRSEPRIIRMIVLAGTTSFFVGTAFQAQMPEFAHHHGSEEADVWYTVLFSANAAGAVIGAVLLESFRGLQGGSRAAIVCAAIWGAIMGIFPLVDGYAAAVAGLTFNQFLVDADEPLLFACGQRSLFASVSAAAARVVSLDRLRWITFSHVESDECGALNDWLAAAPRAVVAHGRLACSIWLNEMADRPPRVLADGEVLDLGGKKVKHIATPQLPHTCDAALSHVETTGTLFCSDLFTQLGECPPTTTGDIVAPAIATEER